MEVGQGTDWGCSAKEENLLPNSKGLIHAGVTITYNVD
jgi:hypothetical protein